MSFKDFLGDIRELILMARDLERIDREQGEHRRQLREHAERLARVETALQLAISGKLRLPKAPT
jgi:hypothetical protein